MESNVTTNRRTLARDRRSRITPEAIDAYRRARAIYDSPCPANPDLREQRTLDYYAACEDLRQALGRGVWEMEITDTIGDEVVPASVVRHGAMKIADWESAAQLRRELDDLITLTKV